MIPATINTWLLRDLILRHVRQPHMSYSAEEQVFDRWLRLARLDNDL
jgi:hypothetical protein